MVRSIILGRSTSAAWWRGNTDFIRRGSDGEPPTEYFGPCLARPPTSALPTPESAAQRLVDGSFAGCATSASDADRPPVRPLARVRPGSTLRFYALRLHEAGMITSTPNQLIAEGTDWRFLNELERKLKA